MHKIMRTIALSLVLTTISFCTSAFAQGQGSGDSSRYDVTVKAVELCSDAACGATFPLGTGEKSFDIASASAGGVAGSYADPIGLPVGSTWTHVRVTVDARFTVTGSGTDGSVSCTTTSANDNTDPTTAAAGQIGGVASPQLMVVPNEGAIGGNPTAADFAAVNAVKTGPLEVQVTYPLTAAYTVQPFPPTVRVEFDTQDTLLFVDNGPSCGLVFPMPPSMRVTITN